MVSVIYLQVQPTGQRGSRTATESGRNGNEAEHSLGGCTVDMPPQNNAVGHGHMPSDFYQMLNLCLLYYIFFSLVFSAAVVLIKLYTR